ncbi:VOC family protein [Streptantibioticus silvisoli]|jgi:predicted enzyme related to lactoylglutathione lyase|uniref:VOC family protein n=1 Tax=Streptantibioticus silvisoli TaxID=2705255 RepID=A0ABT6W6C1_9ACTN|nr:VOC family protein [Streptantibioticus silvisoli]MDI5965839.1 VOC family protein [Streptantibioticus silvisoli]
MLTTRYVPGTPSWTDLSTPEVEAASAFYGTLFGWAFRSAGPGAGGYGMFTLGAQTVAAIGPTAEEGGESEWTVYFHTDDADATTKAVELAGGTVRFGPFDVFTAGRMAGYTDPTGARFAVWQPGERRGLDAVTDVNTLCWTELTTRDPDRAKEFYRSVFDWHIQDMPMGDGVYGLAGPAGTGMEATHSGIMGISDQMREMGLTGTEWNVYFEVVDCDAVVALAEAQGGRIVMPATTMQDIGRMAVLADPFGAKFCVMTSATGA